MKILVLDNYDSFTYNLVHYLEQASGVAVQVHRNDQISLKDVERFDKIVLSPGPGLPSEAGILKELISTFAASKSILGVCLGQQAIGEVYGGSLFNLEQVFHGVATPIEVIREDVLFKGLPQKFNVGRYHSWVIGKKDFPEELEVTARDEQGNIMALRHRKYDLRGVQFHPESILTTDGLRIIRNWVSS